MVEVVICEKFGYTYDEFLDLPMPFVELIRDKMKIDAQITKKESEKAQSKSRKR